VKKIDYAKLAHLLRDELKRARTLRDITTNPDRARFASGAVNAIESVGWQFAKTASVDRDLFIQEAGL